MSDEQDIRDLFAPMADHPVDLEGDAFRVDRARILAAMRPGEQETRAPRRRRMATFVAGGLALAAAAALFVGMRLRADRGMSTSSADVELAVTEGHATYAHGDVRTDVAPGASGHVLAEGDLETARDSKADVRTTDGVNIELRSSTRIALGELRANAVTLRSGAIRCVVPHRATPRVFRVLASDVTVTDLGTVFTVSVDAASHTTSVAVEEGEVMVRGPAGEARVKAPESWSSASRETIPPAPIASISTSTSTAQTPAPKIASPRTPPVSHAPSPPKATATLADEARLLQQGLASERQGRFEDARASLTALLEKYPRSPLAPDARAALARIEARTRP